MNLEGKEGAAHWMIRAQRARRVDVEKNNKKRENSSFQTESTRRIFRHLMVPTER